MRCVFTHNLHKSLFIPFLNVNSHKFYHKIFSRNARNSCYKKLKIYHIIRRIRFFATQKSLESCRLFSVFTSLVFELLRTHEPCVPTDKENNINRNFRLVATWWSLRTLQMSGVKMSVFYGAVCLKVAWEKEGIYRSPL